MKTALLFALVTIGLMSTVSAEVPLPPPTHSAAEVPLPPPTHIAAEVPLPPPTHMAR
jgi:hypothetical protein